MPSSSLLLLVAAIAAAIAALAGLGLRFSGAHPGLARRLAGPAEVRVGSLATAAELPNRAVRVVGRIRCADPLLTDTGDRLVAFHRDVEVETDGGWRTIERLRDTRSFELWDHDGSAAVDPTRFAEPLISIPTIWRGSTADLDEPHASVAQRLTGARGSASRARSLTRTIAITDRVALLALPRRGADGVRLEPPAGGQFVTNLALPDAMRLLGGPRRRLAVASLVTLALAGAVAVLAGLAAGISALAATP